MQFKLVLSIKRWFFSIKPALNCWLLFRFLLLFWLFCLCVFFLSFSLNSFFFSVCVYREICQISSFCEFKREFATSKLNNILADWRLQLNHKHCKRFLNDVGRFFDRKEEHAAEIGIIDNILKMRLHAQKVQ